MAEESAESSIPFATVQLRHRMGSLEIDVDFQLTQPWTILFGASGSGKTTILRAMAGLLQPTDAAITLKAFGRPTVAVNMTAGTFVPAHRRPTRLVAQQAALFPHMTVRENIAFGAHRTSDRTNPKDTVDAIINQFHLNELAGMVPAELSGGERQQVAIARAVTSAVSLAGGATLLLDEPFAGLDAPLRNELMTAVQTILAVYKIPVLSVTHDVAEAFQLGAEVIKLAQGRVLEQGPVAMVLAEARARLLAQLNQAPESPA